MTLLSPENTYLRAVFENLDLSAIVPNFPVRKNLKLDTLWEPPLSEVVAVAMNEFGYVGPGERRQRVETFGLGPCIGVQINSADLGYQILMHCAGDKRWQAQELIRYAKLRHMLKVDESDFLNTNEPITIYASNYSSKRDVSAVYMGLHDMGCNNIEIVNQPKEDTIAVILNAQGERFWLDTDTIANPFASESDMLRMEARAFDEKSLHCVNTDETHRKETMPWVYKKISPESPDRKIDIKYGFKSPLSPSP